MTTIPYPPVVTVDVDSLTQRQWQVATIISTTGWTYEQVGLHLSIAPGTVRNLVHKALKNSGAVNMTSLAYNLGLRVPRD